MVLHGLAVFNIQHRKRRIELSMHALILTDGYPNAYVHAQGIFVRDQAIALAQSGMKVGVVACVPISIRDIWKSGVKALKANESSTQGVVESIRCFVQIPRWYMYPVARIAQLGMPLVENYIAKHGVPDVIHVHGFHSGRLAIEVRNRWQVPIVVTEHNSRFLSGAIDQNRFRFARDFFKEADARIAVSSRFQHRLEQLFDVRFDVVPNTVDVELFKPGKREGEFLFFSAARFDQNKNQQLQIESFARVAHQMPDARLWLAGEGELKFECLRLIATLGLNERVRVTGFLSRHQMIEAMQQSSVYLITSVRETFGVVAIEAMSCGMEVISTPCGGPEETLANRGKIVLPTPEEFSAAMLDAYNCRVENRSHELHVEMVAHYSYGALAATLGQVYSRVIKSHS